MERPIEDQEPLSAIMGDILTMMHELIVMKDYTPQQAWQVAFGDDDPVEWLKSRP